MDQDQKKILRRRITLAIVLGVVAGLIYRCGWIDGYNEPKSFIINGLKITTF